MNADVPSGLTVVEAIDQLRTRGHPDDFSIIDGAVRCGRCGHAHPAEDLSVTAVLRVEGASDPADEAIVAGLACRACQARGVLVAGYGPTEDAREAAVLRRLGGSHPSG